MNSVHRFNELRKEMSKSEIKRVTSLAPELVNEIRDQAFENALDIIRKWTKIPHITLMCGDMTTDERRTVLAVVQAIFWEVQGMKGTAGG